MSVFEKVRISIASGSQYVDYAYYKFKSEDLVIVEIAMHLKRAETCGHGDRDAMPEVYICEGEDSYLNGDRVTDANAAVAFPDFKGWNIYSSCRIGRYALSVVLTKQEKT